MKQRYSIYNSNNVTVNLYMGYFSFRAPNDQGVKAYLYICFYIHNA